MINLDDTNLKRVKKILQDIIPELEVWLFGSQITDKAKPFSDIDLAVITPKGLVTHLKIALIDAFDESDLPLKVDVLDFYQADNAFQKIVEKNHVVLQTQRIK